MTFCSCVYVVNETYKYLLGKIIVKINILIQEFVVL